jgi:hypothetical protein
MRRFQMARLVRIVLAHLTRIALAAEGAAVQFDEPFRGWTPAELFAWVKHQPLTFHRALSMEIWRQPDTMVRIVKEIRALASDYTIPAAARRRAMRLLIANGWDDESLQSEDTEQVIW